MNNLKNKSNKKISQLKLEVVRFDSHDVIATSAPLWAPMLIADENELIANITKTDNNYNSYSSFDTPNTATPGYYYEPTSGQ